MESDGGSWTTDRGLLTVRGVEAALLLRLLSLAFSFSDCSYGPSVCVSTEVTARRGVSGWVESDSWWSSAGEELASCPEEGN